jgi:hypothetical protein
MTWAAPLWLLGLLPWSAVVLYLLWGRRRRTDVPFLDLWQGGPEGVRVRRRVSPPPPALALAILAMLLAILAAGRPSVRSPSGGETVSVVIDRGYTMSARGSRGATRTLDDVATLAESPRAAAADFRRIERWVVPGPAAPHRTDTSGLADTPASTPTALDTRDALRLAVRAALARNAGPAVVLSDQSLGFTDERVIQVAPERPVRNARVVHVAAREQPAAQVMVRVRGGAGIVRGTVRVTSGSATADREVELRPDRDTDAFVDLPRLAESLKAELVLAGAGDDQPADDAAWLVREASWPRLEARAPLPPHVQRMVEVYARARPPSDASRRVILTRDADAPPAGEPAIVLAPPESGAGAARSEQAEPEVRDHPVTQGVTWGAVAAAAPAVNPRPPDGWAPVVSAGGKVWVAVREQPIRAVWIGFETAEWARSPEFVVFWANVFDWAGAGGERFASYPVGSLAGEWRAVELAGSVAPPEPGLWPGLYRRASDGALRALHAPDVPLPDVPAVPDGRPRLERRAADAGGRFELAGVLSLLAVACVALAAVAWKRRNLTGFSVPRSF